jgi:hypothetical protein
MAKPDFIITVATNYNGYNPQPRFEHPPAFKLGPERRDSVHRAQKHFGRFACYRLPRNSPPIELEPETMMALVPVEVLAQVQMALATGVVPRGLKTRLAAIVAEATR